MKTILATLLAFSCSCFTFALDGPPFAVVGDAKLIATFNVADDPVLVKGTLSSGDEITISTLQSALVVRANHNKLANEVYTIEDASETILISVYEYDFDKDGEMELLIVDSPDFYAVNVHVFRYSNGLKEMVGNLFGQFLISLEDNVVSMPYGSQGLTDEYIYRNGAFYHLVYHDPENGD